ncbi:hypothetical protein PR048_025787 [Dryococelus australis]|uniref:SP-RING-type domain-containing protein n=1 Tax=Dryococelus australis TaxID=614101 RepID=A0ABQ9GJJ5_9NEOP|nr:hypothetical protein PR048_025787 [Dryococelus australis]
MLGRARPGSGQEVQEVCGVAVKAKMSGESGAEIAATSLRVSLACPLGKTRMALPCRSTSCSHLQCFDASVFLNMNELRPTWQCPVCSQPCPYDTLVLDG